MSKKEIVNDLTEDATKAVQLQDGRFITQSLYYQHKMQVLKMYLSWHDIKRIVEIADKLCPYTSKDIAEFQENFQTEEAYYKKVLELFQDGQQR